MSEARLTFKREGREGVIPVGTYLSDAARRFGVLFPEKCRPAENIHFCKVSILEGENALTPSTKLESEYFTENLGDASERLACQCKILATDDIEIMTEERKDADPEKEMPKISAEAYAKEFRELPLEKKMAELVQLEAMALGETLSFIANSPYIIFDKVMDVMAGFGMKKEENEKTAARPAEHAADPEVEQEDDEPIEAEERTSASN